MYLSIIIMPLLGSIVSGLLGRRLGVKGSHVITCTLVIFTTILAIASFMEVALNGISVTIYLIKWVESESLNVAWGFNFDSLTVSMLIPVLIVSSLVHLYSIGYMSHDPHNQRFFSYLSLFTFMMIILVTSNNYLLMFVGWEGVGICSYLLVSFWFTRIAANQSSISAILTNRVGDCFLTIGMFALIWSLGNIDYTTIFSLAYVNATDAITIIAICLLLGAMAKSSQIGLHVWLPMAMEGPTPVSALIHAATMVTAGVYLLIRSSPLLEYCSTVLLLTLWIGAVTTLVSSLIGLFQQDIKKVIAYSTMSQLGLMVVAIGLSCYTIALFHLVNHAFYKALLFLGAGAVIHAVADNQDFRKYGALRKSLPLSYSVMLIASLSLVAFPFMTGFYSKDFILESSYGQYSLGGIAVYFIATIGAMFTTLYSVKTLYLTFISNPNGTLTQYKGAHEGNIFMSLPLVLLAIFSIYFGFIGKDMFIGLGSNLFIDNSIFIHPSRDNMIDTEFAVPTFYKLLPLFFTISLTIISLLISESRYTGLISFKLSTIGYNIFSFFNMRLLIEPIYNKYITEVVLKLGGLTTKVLDKGAVELIGPYGLQNSIVHLSRNLSRLDTGVVTTYALYILVGGLLYISVNSISLFYYYVLMIILLAFSYNISKPNYKDALYVELDNSDNNILKSNFNLKFIIKRMIKVTAIAVVFWCSKDLIVYLLDLNKEYIYDFITGLSILSYMLYDIYYPSSYHIADINSGDPKTKHMLLRTFNESNSTNKPVSIARTDSIEEAYNPYQDIPDVSDTLTWPMMLSRLWKDKLWVAGHEGDKSFADMIITPHKPGESTPTEYPVITYLIRDNVMYGLGVSVKQDYILKYYQERTCTPSNPNDLYSPNGQWKMCKEMSNRANDLLELLKENGRAYTSQGSLTLQARQLEFDAKYYLTKSYEAWGVYDSMEHRELNENWLSDVSLEKPHNYPTLIKSGNYPGTKPISHTPVQDMLIRTNSWPPKMG